MDAALIPRYLLDQVKDLPWPVDDFYRLWPLYHNPLSILYALVDEGFQVKGMVWASVIPLGKRLNIHLVSVDRAFQGKGILPRLIMPLMREVLKKSGAGSAVCRVSERHARVYERLGCRVLPVRVVEGE